SKRLQEEYSGKLGGLFEEKYGKAFDKDIQAIGRERDPVVAFTETMYNTLAHQIPGGYQSFMTAETAKIYQDASKRLKNLEDKYPDDSKTVDWKTELVPGVDKTAGAHKEYYRNKIKKTHEQMVKGLAKSQYYQNKMADEN